MTNELEKRFFDTFGIPRLCTSQVCKYWGDCEGCLHYPNFALDYPQITDRILLNLICIANEYENYPETTNMKNIKERTLRILLRAEKFYDKNHYGSDRQYKKLIKQVRTLFKGDNNV